MRVSKHAAPRSTPRSNVQTSRLPGPGWMLHGELHRAEGIVIVQADGGTRPRCCPSRTAVRSASRRAVPPPARRRPNRRGCRGSPSLSPQRRNADRLIRPAVSPSPVTAPKRTAFPQHRHILGIDHARSPTIITKIGNPAQRHEAEQRQADQRLRHNTSAGRTALTSRNSSAWLLGSLRQAPADEQGAFDDAGDENGLAEQDGLNAARCQSMPRNAMSSNARWPTTMARNVRCRFVRNGCQSEEGLHAASLAHFSAVARQALSMT